MEKTNMKGYVVLEKGFDYDDSYYYPENGGTPKNFFLKKQSAIDKSSILNMELFKSVNIDDYLGEYQDEEQTEKIKIYCDSLIEKYGPITKNNTWDHISLRLHPLSTLEESIKFEQISKFSFYEVVEVEIDPMEIREVKINNIIS